jgi:hypothetical protein
MAKKGSGPGDEYADFSALDKTLDDILPLDDSLLNIFARLDDCSALYDILQAEDNVLNEIFGRLDGMQNPTTRHAAAKPRHRGRGQHTEGHAARVGGRRSAGEIFVTPKKEVPMILHPQINEPDDAEIPPPSRMFALAVEDDSGPADGER